MYNVPLLIAAFAHQLYAGSLAIVERLGYESGSDADQDRGAVSLEQVLWFVAAGVSVAVIAGILWSQIKDKADDPITTPAAP